MIISTQVNDDRAVASVSPRDGREIIVTCDKGNINIIVPPNQVLGVSITVPKGGYRGKDLVLDLPYIVGKINAEDEDVAMRS